jgi:heme oxygenase
MAIMKNNSIHSALQQATRDLHSRVEALPLSQKALSPAMTLEDYYRYLQAFQFMHQFVEPQFNKHANVFKQYDIAVDDFCRLGLLQKI